MKNRLARLAPLATREPREGSRYKARKGSDRALEESAERARQLAAELKAVEEELRASNREILKSRAELERLVHHLAAANAELQRQIDERIRLERDLLEIAEKERQRFGFDLHDDLSQQLMGVAFMVKALERKVASRHLPRVLETRQIQSHIDQVINHTRHLRCDFTSQDLLGDDLKAALKKLAARVERTFRISCRFTARRPLPRLSRNVAAQLYKIAQESVSNALRHGKAGLVLIALSRRADNLVLTIKNDGLPIPENRKVTDGMGLRIMHARAGLMGAALEISADWGDGTVVTCTLPLKAEPKPTVIQLHPPAPYDQDKNDYVLPAACQER
jgi:signal transduction histidine kinase